MEQNRVLTLDEVLGLEDGANVWVEINPSGTYTDPSQSHAMVHNHDRYDYALLDEGDCFWGIDTDGSEECFGVEYRVWLREPTPPTFPALRNGGMVELWHSHAPHAEPSEGLG